MQPKADIRGFYDPDTYTIGYLVIDPYEKKCAVIDSVLDYDPNSGRTSTRFADQLIAVIREEQLQVEWLLETHAHADHLSAAPYIKQQVGGQIAIGEHIQVVQTVFGKLFHEDARFARDGSQFDRLFKDGDTFTIGRLQGKVMHTPGHTPACISYLIEDNAFIGDTLFMPDYGTARCDFPGGDAKTLFASIQKIYALPDSTRLYLCHDYPENRSPAWETTVGEQKQHNIHVNVQTKVEDFVTMRAQRDATLAMPRLLLPSVQVNMRAGHLPEPAENGISYLKIPLNAL